MCWIHSGYAKRVVSRWASTVAPVGVQLREDSLEKEERKVCNSERECKFTEVKAAEQSYD